MQCSLRRACGTPAGHSVLKEKGIEREAEARFKVVLPRVVFTEATLRSVG